MTDNVVHLVPPAPRKYAPRAPSTLGPIGQKEWKRVMARMGDDATDEHLALIQAYAEAFEGSAECAAILRKQGRIVQGRKGTPPKAHPAVRQQISYSQQMLRLAEKLGIVAGAVKKDRKVRDDDPSSVFD